MRRLWITLILFLFQRLRSIEDRDVHPISPCRFIGSEARVAFLQLRNAREISDAEVVIGSIDQCAAPRTATSCGPAERIFGLPFAWAATSFRSALPKRFPPPTADFNYCAQQLPSRENLAIRPPRSKYIYIYCGGFRMPAHHGPRRAHDRAGVRKPPGEEIAGSGVPGTTGAMGIWAPHAGSPRRADERECRGGASWAR